MSLAETEQWKISRYGETLVCLLNSGHVAFEALIVHAGGDVEQEGIYWIYWSGAQKRGPG